MDSIHSQPNKSGLTPPSDSPHIITITLNKIWLEYGVFAGSAEPPGSAPPEIKGFGITDVPIAFNLDDDGTTDVHVTFRVVYEKRPTPWEANIKEEWHEVENKPFPATLTGGDTFIARISMSETIFQKLLSSCESGNVACMSIELVLNFWTSTDRRVEKVFFCPDGKPTIDSRAVGYVYAINWQIVPIGLAKYSQYWWVDALPASGTGRGVIEGVERRLDNIKKLASQILITLGLIAGLMFILVARH